MKLQATVLWDMQFSSRFQSNVLCMLVVCHYCYRCSAFFIVAIMTQP